MGRQPRVLAAAYAGPGPIRGTSKLLEVERGRRDMKQILDLRPAYQQR